jgi:hypothetical protein
LQGQQFQCQKMTTTNLIPINIDKNFKSQLNVILSSGPAKGNVSNNNNFNQEELKTKRFRHQQAANSCSPPSHVDSERLPAPEICKTSSSYKLRTSRTIKTISTTISTKKTSLINHSKQILQNSLAKGLNLANNGAGGERKCESTQPSDSANKLQQINKLIVI